MQVRRIYARSGQRWDTISNEVYGNAMLYHRLSAENPEYIGTVTFAGGESLKVPVLSGPEPVTSVNTDLPPWRR